MVKKFQELECWQLARKLVKEVYMLSDSESFDRDFDLIRQLRRAAVSVMSNIAEGFARNSRKTFKYFLSVAIGSMAEVESQLYLSVDLNYLARNKFFELQKLIKRVNGTLFGLMRYLNQKI